MKDQTEWDKFVDAVAKVYGFNIKDICPFIYTLEGNLIGSGSDFMKYVTERFGKHMQIPKDAQ